MELEGEQFIRAPRETVWAALNDPDILGQCIPGCEQLIRTGENQFDGKVTAKVGPVKATFAGGVTLSNITPPASYTITGEGKGGVAGFAKGGADVHLTEQEGGTLLVYTVKAAVGGKLAQIGARLIDGVAREYAEAFFTKFCTIVEAVPPSSAAAPGVVPSNPSANSEPSSTVAPESKKWLIVAAAGILAVLLYMVISSG